MEVEKKRLRLKPIGEGFYTPEGYTPPAEVTLTRLCRITKLLMRKIKPPEKAR
jgi:hypothetical protein